MTAARARQAAAEPEAADHARAQLTVSAVREESAQAVEALPLKAQLPELQRQQRHCRSLRLREARAPHSASREPGLANRRVKPQANSGQRSSVGRRHRKTANGTPSLRFNLLPKSHRDPRRIFQPPTARAARDEERTCCLSSQHVAGVISSARSSNLGS
jgi:hypothetical protein